MEQERYTVPLSKLLQHIIAQQIPSNAKIHYWYETDTLKKIDPIKKKKSWKNTALFGLWEDRNDIEDATLYVEEIRKPRF